MVLSESPIVDSQTPQNGCEKSLTVVVPKCFIKHMCFIVLYFHGHALFSLKIAKKVLFCALFFEKCAYIFVSYLSGWNFYFRFLFITLK